jgi:hypothetical protein
VHRRTVEELLDDPTSSARHPGGRSAAQQPMGGGKDAVRSWGDISHRSHSAKGPGGQNQGVPEGF